MYLEISPRRSGKTERLIKDLIYNMQQGLTCIVFADYGSRTICDRLDSLGIRHRGNRRLKIIRTMMDYNNFICGMHNRVQLYYDEFDSLNSDLDVIIDPRGYYVTSPTKELSLYDIVAFEKGDKYDVLLDLVNNGGTGILSNGRSLVPPFPHHYQNNSKIAEGG